MKQSTNSKGYTTRRFISDIRKDYRCRRGKNLFDHLLVLFFRQDFHLLLLFRISKVLHSRGFRRLAKIATFYQLRLYSCQLSPSAEIEGGVKFPHPIGVVIGDGCIVKRGARIFQHVTIGGKRSDDPISGELAYPTIEADATLFPQAMVVGPITVGEGAIVGAKSLVLKSVAARERVAGIPAKPLGASALAQASGEQ